MGTTFQPMATSSPQRTEVEEQITISSASSQPIADYSSKSMDSSFQLIASSSQQRMASPEQNMKDCTHYLPLYKAILEGDLESVKKLCDSDEHALEATITENLDTVLHVAVGTGRANHIVEYLLSKMSIDKVELQNKEGNTVLSIAAIVGNVEAAKIIMKKDVYLNFNEVSNNDGWIPLMEAARHGQKKMIKYLLQFSESYLQCAAATCLGQTSVVFFISLLIMAGFYDLALDLVKRHPNLATLEVSRGESLLTAIARKPSAFLSGKNLKLFQYVYLYQPRSIVLAAYQVIIQHTLELLGDPRYMKKIRETFTQQKAVLPLIKFLCCEITKLDYGSASSILTPPLFLAAELGVCEVVEEIIKAFPYAVRFANEKNHNVFHLAVKNRRDKVFNLIFQLNRQKHLLLMSQDVEGNNILHLAGKLAPRNQLNLIPGAALQMQRELQWFKVVEKIVQPAYKEDKNFEEKTPAMLFTEAHKELVKEGEKWMKGAATSCLVAAALIATVVFGAALVATVAFAADDNAKPNFYKKTAFNIFGIADALSLFSAIGSIMMFLSILTARYAEGDFLYVLPSRLIWGLVTLFLSLTSMMVAFGATVSLAFQDRKASGIVSVVAAALTCLPIYLFALSQYPLLWDLISSTYGSGIFGKQSTKFFTERQKVEISPPLRAKK